MTGAQLFQRLRGRLSLRFPALAMPLGLLHWQQGDTIGTDGNCFYAPISWLETAEQNSAPAQDALLHSLLHAMLGHPFSRRPQHDMLWDLACDMTVTFLLDRIQDHPLEGIHGKAYYACTPQSAFSARAVYQQLTQDFPFSPEELLPAFSCDNHIYWYAATQSSHFSHTGGGDGLASLWKQQENRLHPYMQPDKPKIGTGTAHQALPLEDIPENHNRFASLLRAYSVVLENRHVNDTDFSYPWYAYGLSHYDQMPLIEPLEYSEERKLRNMVIVLDTSASCSRGLTARFLGAVHAIVCRENLFFERFRLHILQCDCEVQNDTLLTSPTEFQWYLDHLTLYGGGGTDYRPAFEHIDQLIQHGDLPQLGGVLYFTDGYGVFPSVPPLSLIHI